MSVAPIAVVGAGLVGATAALALARRFPGRTLVWLAAGDFAAPPEQSSFDARVIACTPGSAEFLTQLGAWQHLAPQRLQPYRQMQVWDRQGGAQIGFAAESMGVPMLGTILAVADLQRALLAEIAGLPQVETWPGARVTGLKAATGAVRELQLASGERLSCELVVAADGSSSPLRELAGIRVRERSMGQTALVAVAEHQKPHGETARQAFDRDGPLAFLPLPDSTAGTHQSAIVWSLEASLAERYAALSDTELMVQLESALDHQLGSLSGLSSRAAFPLRQVHAHHYVQPGLCLLGDAAHTLHPLAGQGANLGFRDVRALDLELTRAEARGISPGHLSVLRRYERARKLENLAMLASMEAFRHGFGGSSALLCWLRNSAMRRVDAWPLLKERFARQAML